MKLLFLVTVLLLALDLGIRHWRNSAPVSGTPVWSLPMAEGKWGATEGVRKATEIYRADRGAEWTEFAANGTRFQIFYFEWDRVEAAPVMDIGGHTPDVCNETRGFQLLEHHPVRRFDPPNSEAPLLFDSMTFAGPDGNPHHVYKLAWIQGLGSWDIQEGGNRRARLLKSFTRGRGAARVLQCGIWTEGGEKEAWELCQRHVLRTIQWERNDAAR